MSDYIPTTEEVRKYFSDEPLYWIERTKDEWIPSVTKEAFDHWLAEVKEEAFNMGYKACPCLED